MSLWEQIAILWLLSLGWAYWRGYRRGAGAIKSTIRSWFQ